MTNLEQNSKIPQILSETSKIPWKELQYFFAGGKVLYVSNEIDLIVVAEQLADDNKVAIEKLISDKKIAPVTNDQAKKWYDDDTTVWAVVIKPWILVQEPRDAE